MSLQQERRALFLLFLTPALWAVNYWVARAAPDVIAPHALAFARWLVAALVLLVFCGREVWTHRAALRYEWRQLLVLGALGMWICGAWVYIGARSTTAINIGLIYAVSPVLIALLSWTWLQERFAWHQALGVALAVLGLVHIVVQGHWMRLSALQINAGDLWIVACALAWAAYALLIKRWPSVFSPVARLALTALAGCVVMLVPTGLEAAFWIEPRWSWNAFGLVLTSALIPGAAAFFAYAYAQKHLGAARVATALYLGPLYAALLGVGLLGESLQGFHWLGAALILAGVALVLRAKRSGSR